MDESKAVSSFSSVYPAHGFPQVVLFLTLLSIYGLFFTAEHHDIGVSAVLAVVCFGFYMSSRGKNLMIKVGGK
jgi:hypothetical protein